MDTIIYKVHNITIIVIRGLYGIVDTQYYNNNIVGERIMKYH